jgi:sugar lactone lactonase YvrE
MVLALAPTALGVTITDGDIVANDTLTGQVVRVDPDTGATTPIVTIASFPIQGIAIEADGKILVCGRGAGGGPGDFAKVIRIDP